VLSHPPNPQLDELAVGQIDGLAALSKASRIEHLGNQQLICAAKEWPYLR
jgi:hypothetical protein